MINIAIFASGAGTNAENIARYFTSSSHIKVGLILCNNPNAGVLGVAKRNGISSFVFRRPDLFENGRVLEVLHEKEIDFIVLAGFLWQIPSSLIREFTGRIINIHPALLPQFGGKGFYGLRVHQAVIQSGHPISGITIHAVNENLDEGEIIFQAACHVSKSETAENLAAKIHFLEHRYFPVVVEKVLHKDIYQ